MKKEKDWFVYIIECWDESLYTGITNDIKNRMSAHKKGTGSKYVKRKRFKRLLHTIKAVDKIDAAKMEYRIKQLERNDKIIFFLNHPDIDYSVTKRTNFD
jgi:putative endonuclease